MGTTAKTKKAPDSAAGERLLQALKHPLRYEIVRLLTEGTASPNELANRLGVDVGIVSYHVRTLRKLGFLELVDEVKVRGAIRHLYRSIARATIEEVEWARLPVQARAEISCVLLTNMFSEASSALAVGTMDSRADRHITWRALTVDIEGWQELAAELMRCYLAIEAIEARSAARRVRSGDPGFAAIAGLMGFERAPLR